MPRFSIIIPVYNVANFLHDCLRSLLAQTYSDFEVICIDDCSTDNSRQVLELYSAKDSRIKVITLPSNHGAGVSRNRGIENATGEFITFIDPDDWLELYALERISEFISNESIDGVWGQFRLFFEREGSFKRSVPNAPEGFLTLMNHSIIDFSLSSCTKTVKAEFFDTGQLRFDQGIQYEDVGYFFRLWCLSTKIYHDWHDYYIYRRRDGSATTQSEKGDGKYGDIIVSCRRAYDFLVHNDFFERFQSSFLEYYTEHIAVFLFSKYYKRDIIALLPQLFKEIGYPQNYLKFRSPVFDAVLEGVTPRDLSAWYKLLSGINKCNPSSRLRKKWQAWIKVNCLYR